MIKKKKEINLEENMENLSIEEIDEEMKDFYIDEEKIQNIKYDFDKDILIKTALDKADKDISKDKLKKRYIKIAASIVVLLSVGLYSPALAYSVPPVMKILEKVNDILKIDEISAYLEIDTLIPKAVIEDNKIKFSKITRYKVSKEEDTSKEEEAEISEEQVDTSEENADEVDKKVYYGEYDLISFIHQMANKIINPGDGKKYGIIDITPDNIQKAIDSLDSIKNEEAKAYLSKALNRWKNGQFDNGVELHNYVWHMLNGQVGIAVSLDNEEIDKIKNKYFNN